VLVDLGYHLFDLAVAVLNRPVRAVRCLRARAVSTGKGGGAIWYGPTPRAEYQVSDRVEALLQVDEVAINIQVAWVDDTPGDITQLIATGSDGMVEFKGLLGFSNHRRIAEQRCRLLRGGKVVEEKSYLPAPDLHREAFGGVLEEFAGVCRGAKPQVGLSQILATTALIEAVNLATEKR
jgi:predicted dehydrogenase